MQQLVRRLPGVASTRVGYSGGDVNNATYDNHGTHAEAIEITFDPSQTSFRDLLEFFFQIHDPTTPNRQGNDRGTSYRSAIFYTSEDQRRVAEDTIADVEASGLWPGQVVTELSPAGDFWEAEPEHQDYLERIPRQVPNSRMGQHNAELSSHHQLIFPIDTVAVRPATRRRSGGTLSSLMRTGMRCARRTQLKVGLTSANRSLLVLRFWSSMP
jgi:peptide-methionine (S)-S-oxide reductase